MSYLLGFDKAKDNDEVYDFDGLKLIMDKKHVMYVLGFVLNNPKLRAPVDAARRFRPKHH